MVDAGELKMKKILSLLLLLLVMNNISAETEKEEFVEFKETTCAEKILKYFEKDTSVESVWDVSFVHIPNKACIVFKGDTWYDIKDGEKVIMVQKITT